MRNKEDRFTRTSDLSHLVDALSLKRRVAHRQHLVDNEHLGIKVTVVEPGQYATEFGSASSLRRAAENPAYDQARSRLYANFDPTDMGDPTATAAADTFKNLRREERERSDMGLSLR